MEATCSFFPENCMLFLSVIGHASILGSLPRLVAGLGGPTLNTALRLASLAYHAWAARSFSDSSGLRVIATILVGYAAWLIVLSVTVLVVVGTAIVLATRWSRMAPRGGGRLKFSSAVLTASSLCPSRWPEVR